MLFRSSYYWFVWALYKESTGDPVGEWLYLWYRYAKSYSALALPLYGVGEGGDAGSAASAGADSPVSAVGAVAAAASPVA